MQLVANDLDEWNLHHVDGEGFVFALEGHRVFGFQFHDRRLNCIEVDGIGDGDHVITAAQLRFAKSFGQPFDAVDRQSGLIVIAQPVEQIGDWHSFRQFQFDDFIVSVDAQGERGGERDSRLGVKPFCH